MLRKTEAESLQKRAAEVHQGTAELVEAIAAADRAAEVSVGADVAFRQARSLLSQAEQAVASSGQSPDGDVDAARRGPELAAAKEAYAAAQVVATEKRKEELAAAERVERSYATVKSRSKVLALLLEPKPTFLGETRREVLRSLIGGAIGVFLSVCLALPLTIWATHLYKAPHVEMTSTTASVARKGKPIDNEVWRLALDYRLNQHFAPPCAEQLALNAIEPGCRAKLLSPNNPVGADLAHDADLVKKNQAAVKGWKQGTPLYLFPIHMDTWTALPPLEDIAKEKPARALGLLEQQIGYNDELQKVYDRLMTELRKLPDADGMYPVTGELSVKVGILNNSESDEVIAPTAQCLSKVGPITLSTADHGHVLSKSHSFIYINFSGAVRPDQAAAVEGEGCIAQLSGSRGVIK